MCLCSSNAWTARRWASYGLLAGRVGDHFLGGYCDHVSIVSGREIVAENLGLIRGANNETLAVPAAQDTAADDVDIPSQPPTAAAAASAAEAAADAVAEKIDLPEGAELISATEAMDKMEVQDCVPLPSDMSLQSFTLDTTWQGLRHRT